MSMFNHINEVINILVVFLTLIGGYFITNMREKEKHIKQLERSIEKLEIQTAVNSSEIKNLK